MTLKINDEIYRKCIESISDIRLITVTKLIDYDKLCYCKKHAIQTAYLCFVTLFNDILEESFNEEKFDEMYKNIKHITLNEL